MPKATPAGASLSVHVKVEPPFLTLTARMPKGQAENDPRFSLLSVMLGRI